MNVKLLTVSALLIGLAAGCNQSSETAQVTPAQAGKAAGHWAEEHGHGAAPHGGTVFEFGKFHGEFCMDHSKKQATLYILGDDAVTAYPIAATKLLLNITTPQFQADLVAAPQPGDPQGKSSRFTAIHENFAKEQEFGGTISGAIDGVPYLGDFQEAPHTSHQGETHSAAIGETHDKSLAAAPLDEESKIYLTPGGIYTADDIKANGNTVVSKKYKGLKVSHDIEPVAGDKLCPVTMTKANPKLTWVIAEKTYEFCCPPCVEEFVTTAKTNPAEIKAPESYIKK